MIKKRNYNKSYYGYNKRTNYVTSNGDSSNNTTYDNTMKMNSNAKFLIIVESPSKCRKIEEYLGSQYACIASKGHIRTIDGLKNIDIKNGFNVEYTMIEDKRIHVEQMRKMIAKFSNEHIYLATDDDREGEAIAWHICVVFGLNIETTQRIIFHEITKTALQNAVNTPSRIKMELVYAQQARQILDIMVGFKISPILWRYVFSDKENALSAGRCQTPALRLIYDNEMERRQSGGMEINHKVKGYFTTQNIEFDLNHIFKNEAELVDFMEKSILFQHKMSITEKGKKVNIGPPLPFNTSRLLQTVSNQLHYSPKETMGLCQQLYQDGYITYMRTDSMKYSRAFLNSVGEYIKQEWKDVQYIGNLNNIVNTDENNPHEAVRVTHVETRLLPTAITNTHPKMASLYKIIWQNTVESCMSDALYANTMVSITAPKNYEYRHTIEMPLFMGWKRASDKFDPLIIQQKSTGKIMYIDNLILTGGIVLYNFIESNICVKNIHQHYTEASLIKELERLGIGRPSTFAAIVDTIQERGYVKRCDLKGETHTVFEYKLRHDPHSPIEKKTFEKVFGNEKNKLAISDMGIITLEFLIEHFAHLFSYDYTREMEMQLDNVVNIDTIIKTCETCNTQINDAMNELTNIKRKMFTIDENHSLIFYKNGPTIRRICKNENGHDETTYMTVKSDIKLDMEKLKNGMYSLDELVEIKNEFMGVFQGHNVYLKNGRYGSYIEWGENTKNAKVFGKPTSEITSDDVLSYLQSDEANESSENKKILRVLNEWISIRAGKYGPYIYYKHKTMKKPQFFKLNEYNGDHWSIVDPKILLEWIFTTYKFRI